MSIYDLYPDQHEFDVKLDLKQALLNIANCRSINRYTRLRMVYALKLRFKYDRTYAEIGEELGVSTERGRQIIARAIHMLRWHYKVKVEN